MTATRHLRLLHLEHDAADFDRVLENLRKSGLDCDAVRADTATTFVTELEKGGYDLILAEQSLPSIDGLTALSLAKEKRPDTPFILLGGNLAEDVAVEGLKGGATDFVLKNKLERLAPAVLRALREVTERDHRLAAEEELHWWADLFEQAVWGIAICSIETKKLEKVNPGFATMHGYTVEELLGQRLARVVAPSEGRIPDLEHLVFSQPAVNERFETRHQRKDGSTFPVLVDVTRLIDPHSGRVLLGIHVNDLTERKQLEEQLAQAQKMEAVGRLAGGVAHDFNNVLTAIIGYSDLILAGGGLDDQTVQDVGDIKSSAERAASLTRQLLAFSRRQILQPKIVDLNETVEGVEKMLRRVVRESITIECELSSPLDPVKADPSQIEQVLLNLAVNASDAMETGGALKLWTANARIATDQRYDRFVLPAGDYVLLGIRDTGTGMSPEMLDRIFEPFFTTKEPGKGTGLGLAMVYGIVKQSGGYILVDSAERRGTDFRIYFPKAEGHRSQVRPASGSRRLPSGNERILLVEDDEIVRQFVRRVLASRGYEVVTAANGNEALLKIGSSTVPIDLVLTDVVMPELDGKGLAKELSRIHPELRVMYMSGYSHHDLLGEALEKGAQLLRKPFSTAALLKHVRRALDARAEGGE